MGDGLIEKEVKLVKISPFEELAAAQGLKDDDALSLRRLSSHSGVNAVAANLLSPEKNLTQQEATSPAEKSVKDHLSQNETQYLDR